MLVQIKDTRVFKNLSMLTYRDSNLMLSCNFHWQGNMLVLGFGGIFGPLLIFIENLFLFLLQHTCILLVQDGVFKKIFLFLKRGHAALKRYTQLSFFWSCYHLLVPLRVVSSRRREGRSPAHCHHLPSPPLSLAVPRGGCRTQAGRRW